MPPAIMSSARSLLKRVASPMRSTTAEVETAGEFWDRQVDLEWFYWTQHPLISERTNRLVTGMQGSVRSSR